MENKYNDLYKIVIASAILIAALSVSYYFVFYLPQQNKAKIEREEVAKQEQKIKDDEVKQEQLKTNQAKIAKDVQNDCLESTQKGFYDFSIDNTNNNPMFYPYDTIDSFNKNERLSTALAAYSSCITNDPRYDDENQVLIDIYNGAEYANFTIREHMANQKQKQSDLCSSNLLSISAEKICNDLGTLAEEVTSRIYFTESRLGEQYTKEEVEEMVNTFIDIHFK